MAFCCFSLTTSLHPTHASTSRLSTGLAAFGENAPSNPQQHRITFCCFSLTTNSHPTHASTGTLSAGFMRHSLLAQARAGDGTMHHSVLTREAAQRIGVQLPRARCSGFHQKTGDLAREAVNCNAWLAGRLLRYFALRCLCLLKMIKKP